MALEFGRAGRIGPGKFSGDPVYGFSGQTPVPPSGDPRGPETFVGMA